MDTKYVFLVIVEDDKAEKEIRDRLFTLTESLPISVMQEEFNFSWKAKYFIEGVVLTLKNFFMKFKNLHLYIF